MVDALISDGDLVLIEPRDSAKNGEIVVALINNEGATLKRFFKEEDRIRLQPENPTMEPIYINPLQDDLKIQGIVKGVVRKMF
jgi:repressor LexA